MVRERGHKGRKEPCGHGSPESWALAVTKKNRGKDTRGAVSVLYTRDDSQFTVSRVCSGLWLGVKGEAQVSELGPHI